MESRSEISVKRGKMRTQRYRVRPREREKNKPKLHMIFARTQTDSCLLTRTMEQLYRPVQSPRKHSRPVEQSLLLASKTRSWTDTRISFEKQPRLESSREKQSAWESARRSFLYSCRTAWRFGLGATWLSPVG